MVQQAQTAAPTISPAAGTYPSPLAVAITPAVSGTPIYYTVDGSIPTTSSSLYVSTFLLTASATVKAIAVTGGATASSVVTSAFTVQQVQTAAPTISPAAGTYTSPLAVTITPAVSGTPIYYTLDGSTPTTSSSVYSSSITLTASATVKAIAVAGGASASSVASNAFTVNPSVSGGSTTTIVVQSSGSCVDVSGGSNQAGVGIDQWTCTGASNQKFTFTRTPDGYYTIQPQNDNLCFDAGPSVISTKQVVQNPCVGSISQKMAGSAHGRRPVCREQLQRSGMS